MVAANVVLVQLLVTAASVSTAPSQLPWGWPGWNNIATSTWGSNSSCCGVVPKNLTCCSGVDSKEGKLYPTAFFTVATTAVAAPHKSEYKSQFDLVFIDNGIGTPGCDFFNTDPAGANNTMAECHAHRSAGAARIKAVSPKKPVFVYRQISAVLEGCNVTDLAERGLFIKHDDRGQPWAPGILDWRLPEAQQWYVDNVVGLDTATDPNFDGIFIDGPLASSQKVCHPNLTVASKRALFAGLASMVKKVAVLLGSHNKVVTASLGSHYSNLTEFYPEGYTTGGMVCAKDAPLDSFSSCCGYGEDYLAEVVGPFVPGESMFAPFRQFNIPSRDFGDAAHGGNDTLGCAAAVIDAEIEMASGPAFYCNNDAWPNTTDGGVAVARHNLSMAAYL
eukprot:gene10779-471_t